MTPQIDFSQIDYSLIEQGSDEWAQARCGLITASRCYHAFATTTKGEYTSYRERYKAELICERLTGIPYPQYVTKDMLWGREQEQFARAAYEMREGVLVDTCGFVPHPALECFGASPDALIGEDGMAEFKCPTAATYLQWLRAGTIPLEHVPQMVAGLACTQRQWCDFVGYHPAFPPHLQMFVRRYDRNVKMIRMLESQVEEFDAEIDEQIAALPQKPQGIVLSMDQIADDEVQF